MGISKGLDHISQTYWIIRIQILKVRIVDFRKNGSKSFIGWSIHQMELNTRFNELSIELISLSVVLDSKKFFQSFNSDDIFKLAKKSYLRDFTDQDIVSLEYELIHYKLDVMHKFKVSTFVELCQ